jgi:hypothetical protein
MSAHRFRLRFLLQEIDLPFGETLIGRSPECRVTIEDPLVSRVHARVHVGADGVRVEDAGSRNGVRVNGQLLRGPASLVDGDRIRIGTQDVVFCVASGRDSMAERRKTGALRVCRKCKTPYAAEAGACVSCGAREVESEETVSGELGSGMTRDWGVLLLVEVLERCIGSERWSDANRLAQRATVAVEENDAAGHSVDRAHLDRLGDVFVTLALREASANLLIWLFARYADDQIAPPARLLERLDALPEAEHARAVRAARSVWEAVRSRTGVELLADEANAMEHLAALVGTGGASP